MVSVSFSHWLTYPLDRVPSLRRFSFQVLCRSSILFVISLPPRFLSLTFSILSVCLSVPFIGRFWLRLLGLWPAFHGARCDRRESGDAVSRKWVVDKGKGTKDVRSPLCLPRAYIINIHVYIDTEVVIYTWVVTYRKSSHATTELSPTLAMTRRGWWLCL